MSTDISKIFRDPLTSFRKMSNSSTGLLCLFLFPNRGIENIFLNYIESNGIQTRVFFAGNITRHPAYREFFVSETAFPGSDRIMRDCFMLGAHHGLELEDIDYVCNILKAYDQELHSGAKSILDAGECDL